MSVTQHWRKSRLYRIWKMLVIRRDKKCRCCGDRKGRHAHHIKSAAYYPELRFVVSNGITLCDFCHMFIHTKIAPSYRHKATEQHLNALMGMKRQMIALRRARKRALKKIELRL